MAGELPSTNIPTKALVVEEVNAPFKLVDIVLDEVRSDELLIEIKYSGVCHTVSLSPFHSGLETRQTETE